MVLVWVRVHPFVLGRQVLPTLCSHSLWHARACFARTLMQAHIHTDTHTHTHTHIACTQVRMHMRTHVHICTLSSLAVHAIVPAAAGGDLCVCILLQVIESPVPLKVVASSLDELQPLLLEQFEDDRDLAQCIKASAAVPKLSGESAMGCQWRCEADLDLNGVYLRHTPMHPREWAVVMIAGVS